MLSLSIASLHDDTRHTPLSELIETLWTDIPGVMRISYLSKPQDMRLYSGDIKILVVFEEQHSRHINS